MNWFMNGLVLHNLRLIVEVDILMQENSLYWNY